METAKFVGEINIKIIMVRLQDCISVLKNFNQTFGSAYGITKLGIFGSVARGENTEESDIDMVVELNAPTLALMHDLHEALSALFHCKVDLVRLRKSLRPLCCRQINIWLLTPAL